MLHYNDFENWPEEMKLKELNTVAGFIVLPGVSKDDMHELIKFAAKRIQQPAAEWVPCSKQNPKSGQHVELSCKTDYGTEYICIGFHADKFAVECSAESDIEFDYDEEADKNFIPEGFYEVIKNWGDYSSVAINDNVLAWKPLSATCSGKSGAAHE